MDGRRNDKWFTNRKRFASGLSFVYLITSPLDIHSERMAKRGGSADIETPSKGKMFGWDKYFQAMTSRQKDCTNGEGLSGWLKV